MDMVWNLFLSTCLQGSGLKFIFHCTDHSEIFEKSWFKLTVLVVKSCTAENKEVLPAKSFGLESFEEIRLLSEKYFNMVSCMIRSKTD